jgi:hypothetical protein
VTSNKNAREYLDYYLSLPGDPEFAVLLEGPWGSGKTHFVETYFADRSTEARKANPDAKNPLIHVTLFGVRDLSDITTQMFEKAHPILGGKAGRIAQRRSLQELGAALRHSRNRMPSYQARYLAVSAIVPRYAPVQRLANP